MWYNIGKKSRLCEEPRVDWIFERRDDEAALGSTEGASPREIASADKTNKDRPRKDRH